MNETMKLQIARQIVRAIHGGSLDLLDPATITEIESWERLMGVEPPVKKTMRVLRFIEYVGTPEFISDCIARRGLKGTRILPGGFMREGILGDTAEVLSDREAEALGVCRPKTT